MESRHAPQIGGGYDPQGQRYKAAIAGVAPCPHHKLDFSEYKPTGLMRYLPQPASIVAINVLPAAMLFGPPSSTSAEASAVRGPSERRQIGSLAGPLTQPASIISSIAARYIRMVDPFIGFLVRFQPLYSRLLAGLCASDEVRPHKRHKGHQRAQEG